MKGVKPFLLELKLSRLNIELSVKVNTEVSKNK